MTPRTRWEGAAPAKVNLRLQVLARESTGYHQLETVFQALELADEVVLEPRSDGGVVLEVSGVPPGELGADDENLAVRAATAFRAAVAARGGEEGPEGPPPRDRSGSPPSGVTIRLSKRIPHGAGLGGGSSDAASVLRGMNELHGRPLGRDRLLRIGGGLGADVPFFLTGASRALAWGRGDRLMPLRALPAREVVLAVPEEGMSTPEAYRLLAEHRELRGLGRLAPGVVGTGFPGDGRDGPGPGDPEPRRHDHSTGRKGSRGPSAGGPSPWEPVVREATNDFEPALFPHRPELAALRSALETCGGRPALLAGSGSAVFGVFEGEEAARGAVREIGDRFPRVRTLRTRTRG